MFVAMDAAQLFGAIRRDMLQFWFGTIIVTSLGTNPATCTGFQGSLQRLVQLGFEGLQGQFDCLSHRILTLSPQGAGISRAAQRTSQRTNVRRRNTGSDG